jgi:hypothetical protein
MVTLYRKHELARELKVDRRVIERMGVLPAANGPDGKPLFDLESARAQYNAYIAGKERKETAK